ncbi:dsRBD fold-containing protein [Cellulomonas sp. McL0617]|uniref:dsRBD fold-containing protein n=1 Tax=Cellulomonas sp. McL0617 TaxID=3415675 RepID=UPI003CF7B54A
MTHTWKVAIHLFDGDDPRDDHDVTKAHAVLTTSSGTRLEGHGRARRAPYDPDVPEIGAELAAARALREVADRLLRATSDDISELEHRDVQIAR